MISGGNATIFVSNLDRAVEFYTKVLGMKLDYRAGEHWAQVDAGKGFKLGLHPAGEHSPSPGTRGAISIGLGVSEPLEGIVNKLKGLGVVFEGPIKDDGAVRLAFLGDPDGNEIYLCEEKNGKY